ncbi:MAG: diphthine synthase [Nitrososphaerota archaeon]|nr:diphthine synthase [Nitrososphaerota archaeon]
MTELVFVGLGLNDEKGITIKGLEETRTADAVFMETYTSRMPDFSIEQFEALCGRKIQMLTRSNLEEENGRAILQVAKAGKAVFLVPGDPFIATTHITLRIDAEKQGIPTRIVHGISIMSAIVSLSGLHNYKFGKTVTVPFSDNFSETPYNVIAQNQKLGLHTLCLLDLRQAENRYLSIKDALEQLLIVEKKKQQRVINADTPVVGIARAGSSSPVLKAGFIRGIVDFDFGEPPFSLIIPGSLHFMEIDGLLAFAGAPLEFRRLAK